MTKHFALVLLLSAWLQATELYVGLGGTYVSEAFRVENPGVSPREKDVNFQGLFIKGGYGDIDAYAVEIALGYGRYDKNIFSEKDSDYLSIDFSLIKAFDFGIGVYPYGKVGFGAGELEVKRELHRSRSSGSFFAGGGLYLPLGSGIDAELAVLYRDRSWEDVEMIGAQTQTRSLRFEPYFGLNYRF